MIISAANCRRMSAEDVKKAKRWGAGDASVRPADGKEAGYEVLQGFDSERIKGTDPERSSL